MTRKGRRCPDCGGSFTGRHPQAGFTDEYGVHVHVDEGIARLVTACWAAGIPTTEACQGDPDADAYLAFPPGIGESFARAVTSAARSDEVPDPPDDSLDVRIYSRPPEGWWWGPAWPWQSSGFACSFPPEDIPELTRRLEARRS